MPDINWNAVGTGFMPVIPKDLARSASASTKQEYTSSVCLAKISEERINPRFLLAYDGVVIAYIARLTRGLWLSKPRLQKDGGLFMADEAPESKAHSRASLIETEVERYKFLKLVNSHLL